MNCKIVTEKLDAYVMDALDHEEQEQVNQHIHHCLQCQNALKETIQAFRCLQALPGLEPREKYADKVLLFHYRHQRFLYLFMATIAMLVAIIFLLLLWWLTLERRQSLDYACAHLDLLEKGIWLYHAQHKTFPKTDKDLKRLLTGKVQYIHKNVFQLNKRGKIVDAWGQPYSYRCPGVHNPQFFDLYSFGRNNKDEQGRGDDISNW